MIILQKTVSKLDVTAPAKPIIFKQITDYENVPRKSRGSSEILKRMFRISPDPHTKSGRLMRSVSRIKYIGIAVAFAAILGIVFDKNIWKLYNAHGDLPNALEGMFSILMSLTFAIIGVYLIVHVLHPHFGKKPMPATIERIMEEDQAVESMSRDELLEFVKGLGTSDKEIEAYLKTISVKRDVAVTLGMSLVAFFLGMYGYMTSYTIGLEAGIDPNILPVSICFGYIIFSNVYMILKTMNVIWDV
ncbi:MAG: hypothetical protein FWG41_01330 [Methanomassiliicoccaceae archaeon]|nr:hypothetical protein [Methanomassiliicoccaceae archaeon]